MVRRRNSRPSWKLRRRAVFGSLLFAMAIISLVTYRNDDTRLAETLVISSFALIGTIVTAYIGGSVYEDSKARENEEERV
jgi:DMSO reductase anchor subunit